MLRNYLTTSLRILLRYKSYSIINVFGLTLGLATTLLIFLWVMDEWSFDKFHAQSDRIYSVMSNQFYPDGKIETYRAITMKLAHVIQAEIPEADQISRVTWNADLLLKFKEQSFTESGMYVDPSFFSIFSFPIIGGNASRPLPDLKSISISEKVAKKLFGQEDPIGKVVQLDHRHDLTVSCIFKDVPGNSTLQFDFLLPFEMWEKENPWADSWKSGGLQILVTLKPGANITAVNKKLGGMIKKNCEDCTNQPSLVQFAQLHLHNKFENGKSAGGRIDQVMLFGFVAIIILAIACINFMNLATARSATRIREVGVRKSVGANKSGIVVQFLTESMVLSCVAFAFAIAAVQLVLPFFNEITGKSMALNFSDPQFASGCVAITVVCGLLAGSYPAFFMSSFKAAMALKGNTTLQFSGTGLRQALVVVQFIASTILIVGSLVIYDQIQFIMKNDLGFDRENVMVVDQHEGIQRKSAAFKSDVMQLASVKGVGFGGSDLSAVPITMRDAKWPGKPDELSVEFKVFRCDQGFIPTMNIHFLAGRNFIDANRQDSVNYIINNKAMEVMGLTRENVIGAELQAWNGKGKIIGVTADFNNGTLREKIEPLIFMYSTTNGWYYFIRVNEKANTAEVIAGIEKVVKKYEPDYPFQYSFLHEVFEREYRSDFVMGKLAFSFTVVAVLISCLGLFGLASFTAERRTKELGVRKVLGATSFNLVVTLCRDFVLLVTIAMLMAIPVSWYFAKDYLSGFVFHAPLAVWKFLVPGLVVLGLTLITVGYQSLKVAHNNPVDALRSE